MLIICFKVIKQKGSTVAHLQYQKSSARWHPNYINRCLFCVLRHKTWLKIYRKVRGKTALSRILQTVFKNNWIQADNRAKVHLPGSPTLQLTVSLLPLQEFMTSQPELSLVDYHNDVRLGDSRQPSRSENQYSSEAVRIMSCTDASAPKPQWSEYHTLVLISTRCCPRQEQSRVSLLPSHTILTQL